MINIILTVLFFNILIIIFKMFDKYKIDSLQALIINYITAAICSYFYVEKNVSIEYILQSKWLFHSLIIGALFIIVFNYYSKGIQKVGISITTVANKMSLIIPVCLALILYPSMESFTIIKGIATILALLAIYLTSTKKGKINFKKKYIFLILFIFVGQGISDAIFNDFAQSFSNVLEQESFLFFMTLFLTASVSGIIIYLFRPLKSRKKIQFKSIFWGIVFGVPNFFSLYYFLKALKDPNILSSEVFPLVSMGVIITSSLIGLIIFKEAVSKNNWIGILFSIIAIYLFFY